MTIYYLKQDDTIWGCGDPGCCGEYYEDIRESFVNCECGIPEAEMTGDHLWGCNGGGPVLKWRKAKPKEIQAYQDGISDGYSDGWESGIEWEANQEARKVKPKEQKTVHQLVHEGYTIIIQGNGVKETYYAEEKND